MKKVYSENDLIEQLEHFTPSTLANLTLVSLGARKAYYLQDRTDLTNIDEYYLDRISNPEKYLYYLRKFKEDMNDEQYTKIFYEYFNLFNEEEKSLHIERFNTLMKKYYPKLYIHEFPQKSGSFIISKNFRVFKIFIRF